MRVAVFSVIGFCIPDGLNHCQRQLWFIASPRASLECLEFVIAAVSKTRDNAVKKPGVVVGPLMSSTVGVGNMN